MTDKLGWQVLRKSLDDTKTEEEPSLKDWLVSLAPGLILPFVRNRPSQMKRMGEALAKFHKKG